MPTISLPHNWRPRPYQTALWNYLEGGGKRAVACWHRRAGKDEVLLHWSAVAAMQRPGVYWTLLPEASQARKAIFDAVDPHTGKRRIDQAFPPSIRESTNETDMKIKLKSGSVWQVVGSDNYQSLVGTPPCGLVFSEFSRAVPEAWGYLSPILTENRGWAAFVSTPLGNNHFKRLLEDARTNPKWFCEILPVQKSNAIPVEALEESRREYIALYGEAAGQALFAQEYECSFASVIPGAYFTSELNAADREGRIATVDVRRDLPIHTSWDLGMDDPCAIWVWQVEPGRINVVDYFESSGHGLHHYVDWLNDHRYRGGIDWVPHDAKVRELGTGRTRVETLISLGRKPRVVPAHTRIDGISAARQTIPLAHFDAVRCAKGIEALRAYAAEWDESARTYKQTPAHNWASHASDSWRYASVAWKEPMDADPAELTPREIVQKMIAKPKTFQTMWDSYVAEMRRDEDGELPDYIEDFALSKNSKNIRME